MAILAIDDLFEGSIFPGFPFRNQDWLAVAFERNGHDNTRMPEWFFRSASKYFNPYGGSKLLIKGDCFSLDGQSDEVVPIAFDWESYHDFMLSPKGFSLEYKMANDEGTCGCWADTELTVFGGASNKMHKLLSEHGGQNSMLARMEQDFFLDERAGNDDMRAFFRCLLFPDNRKPMAK